METQRTPVLVAHRGYSDIYPENTLIAIEKALYCGACFVEFDVQISGDGVPVVIHDIELIRTTGMQGNVNQLPAQDIIAITAGEPIRFGDQFSNEKIPTLQAMVNLLRQWPSRKAFLEIKCDSIHHFGIERVMQNIKSIIEPALGQIIIISFNAEVLQLARTMGCAQIGWVFDHWHSRSLDTAISLMPDYVFADIECVPTSISTFENIHSSINQKDNSVPNQFTMTQHVQCQPPWQWAVYETSDATIALNWANKGATLVETNAIGKLLNHAVLNTKCCRDR